MGTQKSPSVEGARDPAVPQSGTQIVSNAKIADRLASFAQLLSTQKESLYKVKAYQRAAAKIRTLSESLDELVRRGFELTSYPGIGVAIDGAIREIVQTGTLQRLEELRSQVSPEVSSISDYPRLDPKRIQRIYKKLAIGSIDELREKLDNGAIEQTLGSKLAQHVRQGITETHAMLLYRAHELCSAVGAFLLETKNVRRIAAVGDYRRRVEVIEELAFIVDALNFDSLLARIERYGGRTPLLNSTRHSGAFALSSGVILRIQAATQRDWGLALIRCTGSKSHLRKLCAVTGSLAALKSEGAFPSEESVYGKFGLSYIEPELREGNDEVQLAARGALPALLTVQDVRGELHAHSTSSDGSNSIEEMAAAAQERGYEYVGITDHSQSLRIAGGVSVADLWKQIRNIDTLNRRLKAIRVLKSAEVDTLDAGTLDYPVHLL